MNCTIISDGSELKGGCRNEHEKKCLIIKRQLQEVIWQLYCDGYDNFYVNCEYGIPLWSAEIISALKMYNIINLNLVIPYEEQSTDWDESVRDRYFNIHVIADTVTFACTKYESRCYKIADEIMIDECSLLVIFSEQNRKLYAEKYASERNVAIRKIIIKNDDD